ncbi:nitrilase-related carbon-nitrogen hydrolase [Brevibacterium litoralis]|uniref:nitrilase-related carbon-nitrogen hydrolase n=1 Tax=Brevibacterium litoralis TaxID=3138935 RepID=UPI0032EBEBC8
MRVSAIQLAYTDDEPVEERITRACDLVRAQHDVDLVVLPELWTASGFGYREWGHRAETVESGPTVAAVAQAARDLGAYVHAGSIIEASPEAMDRIRAHDFDMKAMPVLPDGERGLWNTSVLVSPAGEVVTTYRKIHRFGFGNGEPKLLEAGTEVVTADIEVGGRTVTLGLATCYDLRFPELFRRLVDAGTEVLVAPAAWPAARVREWDLMARARAVENEFAVVAVNTAGFHARTQMGGHSVVLDAAGIELARAGVDETVLVADIDIDAIHERRASFPVLADRRL